MKKYTILEKEVIPYLRKLQHNEFWMKFISHGRNGDINKLILRTNASHNSQENQHFVKSS